MLAHVKFHVVFCSSSSNEHGANHANNAGLIPIRAIHFKAGLDDPFGSFPPQNILGFCEKALELSDLLYWTIWPSF